MVIEVDRNSGFCFGVRNAVEIAEKALLSGEKIYSLGSIVHNDMEVKRLYSLGLATIDHRQFRELRDCKVLIRAHGEPPETYQTAKENNITIIEATCPIVKKLQSEIRDKWSKLKNINGQVVIFGKPGLAEVIGLMGLTADEAILISGPDDIVKIDPERPVELYSQTTMELEDYKKVRELIYNKIKEKGRLDPDKDFIAHSTVCGQVSNREPHLRRFAAEHEIIIFVSGKESSNGKMLYSVCKNVNPETYFVSSPEEINSSWFSGKKTAGICGGTSTPKWLLDKIKDHISNI